MQKYNEYQKIVALLLSTIIMLQFSGCYSLKGISKGEIQYANRNYYFVHGNNSSYQINNVNISNGILTGKFYNYSIHPEKSIRLILSWLQVCYSGILTS